MPDRVEGRLELRSLLAAVEVAAVDVFAVELGKRLAAQEVTFLIADFNGSALVRLTAGTAAMVNAGHPSSLRMRDGRVDTIKLAADPPF